MAPLVVQASLAARGSLVDRSGPSVARASLVVQLAPSVARASLVVRAPSADPLVVVLDHHPLHHQKNSRSVVEVF